MMDCIQAQQILSEAVDHEQPISPNVLAEARAHCRQCVNCAQFVQGLALLERALMPQPAASVHARVMAAVEVQRAADAALAQPSESSDTEAFDVSNVPSARAPDASMGVPAATPVLAAPISAARRRTRRRAMLAWAGAAAAVLIVAAFAAVYGLRNIVSPTATSTRSSFAPGESSSDKSLSESASGGAGVDSLQSPGGAAGSTAAAPNVAADFIAVKGIVYRSAGALAIDRSQLATAGTTSSALDTGGPPQTLTVYATPTSGQVALITDSGTIAFDMVTRRLGGQAFALTSNPISAFGVWPLLPSGFIEPTTPDGAPTFVVAQKDDLGVQVYSRPGIAVADGFAIAPRTAESDPARGNPNWTWWTRTIH